AIGIGDTVFFESTRAIGLSRAMTIATTYPVGAALLAAAFLDEPLTIPVIVGSFLTLGGVALIVSVPPGDAAPHAPGLRRVCAAGGVGGLGGVYRHDEGPAERDRSTHRAGGSLAAGLRSAMAHAVDVEGGESEAARRAGAAR